MLGQQSKIEELQLWYRIPDKEFLILSRDAQGFSVTRRALGPLAAAHPLNRLGKVCVKQD